MQGLSHLNMRVYDAAKVINKHREFSVLLAIKGGIIQCFLSLPWL